MNSLKKFTPNRLIIKGIFVVAYTLLFVPYLYSIYYSMPANDDFAWAIEWWTSNRLVEMFHRVAWNYMNYFGQSGIMAVMLQVTLNPLYLFDNAGHSFGIMMMIYNSLIMIGILVAVRKLFKEIFEITSSLQLDVLTLITAALLTTSYYYSDVYNWWSGVPGYSFTMMLCLLTCAYIVAFLNEGTKKSYIIMIVLGILTCTSMMYCVAIGGFYVLYMFIIRRKDGDLKKKITPLVAFIVAGVLMVIAPGNSARMASEQRSSGMAEAISVTLHRTITRAIVTVQTKPWVLCMLVIILLMGLLVGTSKKVSIVNTILGGVVVYISAFTAVLLYVYGQQKTIDSEFTPRIYYVEDYMMFVGAAIIAFAVGCFIKQIIHLQVKQTFANVGIAAVALLSALYVATGMRYAGVIQYDIYSKAPVIQASWVLWNGILDEVIAAEDGADVVIERQNVPWCQYSYYTSIDEDYKEPLSADAKYGNCNECAAKYYGVNSIVVYLY